MSTTTLFDQGPPEPDPKKDDAPTDIGDGVEVQNSRQKSTNARRRTRVRDTSLAAYCNLGPESRTQAARILALIIEAGAHGLTDEEGGNALGIKPQSYTSRRGELEEAGLLCDSGTTRPTSAGRAAIVWVATTLGGTQAPPTSNPATSPTTPPVASDAACGAQGGAA